MVKSSDGIAVPTVQFQKRFHLLRPRRIPGAGFAVQLSMPLPAARIGRTFGKPITHCSGVSP